MNVKKSEYQIIYNTTSAMQNKYNQRKKTKKKYAKMLTMVISR